MRPCARENGACAEKEVVVALMCEIRAPERTSRDCLLIRFSHISFKPSLNRAYPL